MDNMFYSIRHKETNLEGVADLINEQLIRVYYGRDNGEDDCAMTHKKFFEEFMIIGFIFEEDV